MDSIEAMILCEAIDQRQAFKKRKLSAISSDFQNEIRPHFPSLKKDRALAKEISALAQFFNQY